MDRHLDGGGRLSDKTKKGLQESHHKFKAVSTLLKEQEAISLKAIDDIATTMETIEYWSSRSGDPDMLGKTRARYVALLRAQQDILERVSAAQRKPLVSRHKGLWSV